MCNRFLRLFAVLLCCASAFSFSHAFEGSAALPFQKIEGCEWIEHTGNDGDSFHVRANGKEFIFRLYFVDTPESASDNLVESRIADQAKYFGINEEQSLELGKQATAFTRQKLSGPFTVYTRWRNALGRSKLPRYYAFVVLGTEDLAQSLVSHGLARIYGTRTPLPDGSDSRAFLENLGRIEADAKSRQLGGWHQ